MFCILVKGRSISLSLLGYMRVRVEAICPVRFLLENAAYLRHNAIFRFFSCHQCSCAVMMTHTYTHPTHTPMGVLRIQYTSGWKSSFYRQTLCVCMWVVKVYMCVCDTWLWSSPPNGSCPPGEVTYECLTRADSSSPGLGAGFSVSPCVGHNTDTRRLLKATGSCQCCLPPTTHTHTCTHTADEGWRLSRT